MRTKLKLHLEDLTVDSFDTTRPTQKQGTVFGEQCTCYTQCTCPGCPTCDATCDGTCDASCNGTCNCPSGATCLSGDTCEWSCRATDCGWGYTGGNCTALQTNCDVPCI